MKSIISRSAIGILAFVGHAIAVSSGTSRAVAIEQLRHIQDLAYGLSKNITLWDSTDNLTNYGTALTQIHFPARDIALYLLNATKRLEEVKTTYSITDAFRLAGATQDLAYAVNISVASLNKREPEMTGIGIGTIVQGDIRNLTIATTAFADLLLSYVETKLRPVAYNLRAQALESLDMGLKCFNATGEVKAASCSTAMVDPQLTHQAARRFGAIKNNGDPIA